nr:immunoglobulin heavy chain junction region [Macaca mulatta]MOX67272.1 immunoglobulin heavy chain junction region [Macaca mulatta]MOX68684.1 immunoglobulin heavy chain junction region [Macaca mulatta]
CATVGPYHYFDYW